MQLWTKPISRKARQGEINRNPVVRITALFALVFFCGTLLSCQADKNKPVNILMIVVDTLRADRLGCYGWTENTSPAVDQLANSGVLFENMRCQVPQTLPSFCSILTGTYPRTHGVRVNGLFKLSPDAETIAEIFKKEGFETAAFIAGFPLDARFGLKQGFDTYLDEMKTSRPMTGMAQEKNGAFSWAGHSTKNFENTADIVTEEALSWMEKQKSKPFFMMVHYFDPHHDYVPPEPFKNSFSHPYAGEIAFTDQQIGRLVSSLNTLNLEKQTLIILTADHGECLGEHGRYYHQGLLYDGALRVPFVVNYPEGLPGGKRISGACESIDILPTILDIAKINKPSTIQGKSLVPAINEKHVSSRPVFFDSLYAKLEIKNGITRQGVVHENWKLIVNQQAEPTTGRTNHEYELYHLANDPEELVNLAAVSPAKTKIMKDILQDFIATHPEQQAPSLTPDFETIQKLRSLGYLE